MSIKYNEIYYTVIKKRDEKEIVINKYGNIEIHYIKQDDFITPNHYNGRKNDSEILK